MRYECVFAVESTMVSSPQRRNSASLAFIALNASLRGPRPVTTTGAPPRARCASWNASSEANWEASTRSTVHGPSRGVSRCRASCMRQPKRVPEPYPSARADTGSVAASATSASASADTARGAMSAASRGVAPPTLTRPRSLVSLSRAETLRVSDVEKWVDDVVLPSL